MIDPEQQRLFIFAGQRDEEHLADMWECDLKTMSTMQLYSDTTSAGGPEACFAPRAVIDPSLKEIYLFVLLSSPFTVPNLTFSLLNQLWRRP